MDFFSTLVDLVKPKKSKKDGEKVSSAVVNPENEQSNKNISSAHIVNNISYTYPIPGNSGLSTTEPPLTTGTKGAEQKEKPPRAQSDKSGKLKKKLGVKSETKVEENLVIKLEAKLEENLTKKFEEILQRKLDAKFEDDFGKKLEGKLEQTLENKLKVKLEEDLENKILLKLEKKFEDKFEKKRNLDGEWIPTTLKDALTLGDRALVAGYEKTGKLLWIVRAIIQNDLMPGNMNIACNGAYFCHAGKEHDIIQSNASIEVFCASSEKVRWVESRNGCIPPNAVVGGHTSDGENLYIGRAKKENTLIPGKVYRGILYIPFYEKEVTFSIYEVLCFVRVIA